jgi:hypothetical protein
VINIILTVVNPTGALAWIALGARLAQTASAVNGGIVALSQGRLEDAGMAFLGAALTGMQALGPCKVNQLLGPELGLLGSTLGAGGAMMGAANAIDRIKAGDGIGGGLALVQSAADVFSMMRSCFTAEMLLDTEHGKKRADTIQVGDKLWSRSEFEPHGPIELKEVEEVFVRTAPIWNVHVAGQIIRTTAEHPFFVVGRGWVPAQMLQIGDMVSTRSGLLVPVEGVADSGAVETVYNWRVEAFHTYFVSGEDWGFSVWAHNAGGYGGAGADPAARRPGLRRATRERAQAGAQRAANGDFVDPNTGTTVPQNGPFDYGHPPGNEWWRTRDSARAEGWTRQQVIEHENSLTFQVEDPSANRSHRYEQH